MTGKSCQSITGHTPTPWHIKNEEAIKIADSKGYSILSMYHTHLRGRRPTNEVEANAALIVEAVNSYATLRSRAEQDAKRIEDLEAALRCISTPADVSKMKARIDDQDKALREIAELYENAPGWAAPEPSHPREYKMHQIARTALQRGGA